VLQYRRGVLVARRGELDALCARLQAEALLAREAA
jgi:hypothetical protein